MSGNSLDSVLNAAPTDQSTSAGSSWTSIFDNVLSAAKTIVPAVLGQNASTPTATQNSAGTPTATSAKTWLYVGGGAVVLLLLGFLVMRRR